jgi:hypothetical protein
METAKSNESFQEEMARRAGRVSPEEAIQIARRYNASHFRNNRDMGECARYTIPADPTRDDDLRLGVFIHQAKENEEKLQAWQDLMKWLLEERFIIRWESSKGMARFIFENFNDWLKEYKVLKDVRIAAEHVKANIDREAKANARR